MRQQLIRHILFGCNDGYSMPLAVLIASILETQKLWDINFHIIGDISEKNEKMLKDTIQSLGNNRIVEMFFYKPNDSIFKDILLNRQGIATLYRLLAPILLPEHIDKILYLDCDMLVIDSLDELYNTDISEFSVAVINGEGRERDYLTLNYSFDLGYFNAGMLLINLSKWREYKICEQAIDFLQKNKMDFLDQDALNFLLINDKLNVSIRFNVLCPNIKTLGIFRLNIKKNNTVAAILHFIGKTKPWHKEFVDASGDKNQKLWLYFKSKTAYKNQKLSYTKEKGIKGLKIFLLCRFFVRKFFYNFKKGLL